MRRLLLLATIPVLSGCALLQRITATGSSAPEPDRSLWAEYRSEYRGRLIRVLMPASRRFPQIRDFSPSIPDRPPLPNAAVGQILSADYDVETGQGFPELVVDMGIFASPPGTTTGQELAALRDDFMAIAPRDCRLDAETVTGQGMDWLHIAWTNRQHGYMIKDAYLCPLSRDRYLYLVGQYGGMALKPEWLAVRRQVVEDIFRSVRIEPKE